MSFFNLLRLKMLDLDLLASQLTLHQAAALLAKVHELQTHEKGSRFGLYPIKNWEAFQRLKKLEAGRWTADEIEFSEDKNDFDSLAPEEKQPLLMAFSFFAVGDASVAGSIAYRMILTAPTFEQQAFYICQLDNERTHGETYGQMIHTLVTDSEKREAIFSAVDRIKSIKAMNQFIEDIFTTPDGNRALYVCLACSEFLMFIPLFCVIFWYKGYMKGKLRRIIFSNEQIAKDEALHCLNGCENYKELPKEKRYSNEEIFEVIKRVVALVDDFADETLSGIHLRDLSPKNVKGYVRIVADDLLRELGHSSLYNQENPFPWMDFIRLRGKTNFYEGPVGEYSRFNVKKALEKAKIFSDQSFEPEEDSELIDLF